jgi:hypothetical protein
MLKVSSLRINLASWKLTPRFLPAGFHRLLAKEHRKRHANSFGICFAG